MINGLQERESKLQFITEIYGNELWIKRDDLLHPEVSGNKWRKLSFTLEDFRISEKEGILTFGGAYSNHIAAVAALGKELQIKTRAIVRGQEVRENPTLNFCRKAGMEIITVSREEYRKKEDPHFINQYNSDDYFVIAEGGKGPSAMRGCMNIVDELESEFDIICCPGGTGTTMAGMLCANYTAHYRLYPALKGGGFLKNEILALVNEFSTIYAEKKIDIPAFSIAENYHFGGYGKVDKALIDFMNCFYDNYAIPLDPVYTGKMMYGILEDIRKGSLGKGKKILAIHTGGLQGIKGMNERLKRDAEKLRYGF